MRLDTGKAWNDAVALGRNHAELLLAIAGMFLLLPALLLELFAPMPAGGALAERLTAYMELHGGKLFLAALVTSYGQATIFALLLDANRPTVAEALREGLRRLPWFVVLNLLVGMIWLGGFLLFIIPGLYLVGRLALAQPALVSGRLSDPMEALRRAWRLSDGNGWRILALLALVRVLGTLIVTAAVWTLGAVVLLLAKGPVAAFLLALVDASFGAAVSVVLLLVDAAIFRQLLDD
ncbi:hypothetical protein ACMT1E_07725 [Sphingomonas flavalba]|uniref:hypothetical protein n=1 Tax=Sphingomonas flavalba TaxID=2559804 RepID=UPI0039E14CA0